MEDYCLIVESAVYGFLFAIIISPLVISFIKKEKVKQTILSYVEAHSQKSGTPTMGGIIFLIAIPIVSLICFRGESLLATVAIIIFEAYGLIGFLDDFIKFKFKRNLGLRAYQKIIFQFSISIIIGFFVYKSNLLGGETVIPFTKQTIDLGVWIIPVVAIIYLATTNAVNLTDGLDGLATATAFGYMLSFTILSLVLTNNIFIGLDEIAVSEIKNMARLSSVSCGVLLSFLVFNCFPAKIFMGDTGSLAIGSLVATIAVFSKMSFYIPILGIMFVLSAVSVIMQVAYYKLSKKRIFLMAPLHHHFEKKGVHEVRITVCYVIITILVGFVTIMLNIL